MSKVEWAPPAYHDASPAVHRSTSQYDLYIANNPSINNFIQKGFSYCHVSILPFFPNAILKKVIKIYYTRRTTRYLLLE